MPNKHCYVCDSEAVAHHKEYFLCEACKTLQSIYSYQDAVYDKEYAELSLQYSLTSVNLPLMLNRLALVSRLTKELGTVLDIGCGVGEFLRFAERYYTCYGVEPNSHAQMSENARCNSKVYPVLNGTIPPVNTVTLFDVLEHIEDPREMLKTIHERYLLSHGHLVVIMPCIDGGFVTSPEIEKWKHYKIREHLFLFSKLGLAKLLAQAGFKVVAVEYIESEIRPGNPNHDIITMVGRRV